MGTPDIVIIVFLGLFTIIVLIFSGFLFAKKQHRLTQVELRTENQYSATEKTVARAALFLLIIGAILAAMYYLS